MTLEVTAKPSPSEPPEVDRIWLTTPTTSPAMLNSGPPESPGSIAASVWKNSAGLILPRGPSGFRRALMCPTVRVWLIPSGAPTTKTWSPTWTASESPRRAARGAVGARSSWSSATSAVGSDETTRACRNSPVRNSTTIASAVWTTCAAVRTCPSADTRIPDPSPATLTGCVSGMVGISFSFVWMTTTAGSTLLKISDRFWAAAEAGAAPRRTADSTVTVADLIVVPLQGRRETQATVSDAPTSGVFSKFARFSVTAKP